MHFNDEYFDSLNAETQAYIIFSYFSGSKNSEKIDTYLHKLKAHENNYINARNMMLEAIKTIKEEHNK